MSRFLHVAVLALLTLGVMTESAFGLRMALRTPAQRALASEVVVVGKVTAIEKELVDLPPFPGAPTSVGHRVAVVKIETNLAGAANITHLRIAFVPPAKPAVDPPPGAGRPVRRVRGSLPGLALTEGQEMLFFLIKHPNGEFYVMSGMSPPMEINGEAGKKELATIKKITETIAEPMRGLKSDKPSVRGETAAIMVMKYRSYPETAREVEQLPINVEESKLILRALAEAEWPRDGRGVPGASNVVTPYAAYLSLGLTEQDGWKQPALPKAQAGVPPPDYTAIQKDAFKEWLASAGKDYVIKKFVAKK
jgi:hypothetical protein